MKIQPNLNSILIPPHLKDNFRPTNDDMGRVVAEASSTTTNNVAASEVQSKTLWCFTFRVSIIAKGTFKALLYWYYFSIKWTVIIKLAVTNKLQNYFFVMWLVLWVISVDISWLRKRRTKLIHLHISEKADCVSV